MKLIRLAMKIYAEALTPLRRERSMAVNNNSCQPLSLYYLLSTYCVLSHLILITTL